MPSVPDDLRLLLMHSVCIIIYIAIYIFNFVSKCIEMIDLSNRYQNKGNGT